MMNCSSEALLRELGTIRARSRTEHASASPTGSSGGDRRHVIVHPDDHEKALALLRAHALYRIDAVTGPDDPATTDWYGADVDTAALLHVRLHREPGPSVSGDGGERTSRVRPRRDRPGPVIALIGCDGSGKSSVSRWLADELDGAFGARFMYFGTGDGPGSALLRTLNALKKRSRYQVAAQAVTDGADAPSAPSAPSAADSAPDALRLLWAAVVARERLAKLRDVERATRAGLCVVTDRYPQAEESGIHDGPRLGHLLRSRSSGFRHALARREQTLYERLARRIPERVLLLDVPVEVAVRRRPEESFATLSRRIAVARSLRFGGAQRVVIDASRTLPEVQTEVLGHALETLAR